jgi:hypothetical protein
VAPNRLGKPPAEDCGCACVALETSGSVCDLFSVVPELNRPPEAAWLDPNIEG